MDGKILVPARIGTTRLEKWGFMIKVSLPDHSCMFQIQIFLVKKIFLRRGNSIRVFVCRLESIFHGRESSQQFYSILVLHPLTAKKEEHLVDLCCCRGPWYKIFDFNSMKITVFQRFLNLTISFWNIEIEFSICEEKP